MKRSLTTRSTIAGLAVPACAVRVADGLASIFIETRPWRRARFLALAMVAACRGRTLDLGGHPSGNSAGASNGEASRDIFLAHQNGAVDVFVDDSRVYWLTLPENTLAPPEAFRSCLKDDCASTIVTYFSTSEAIVNAVAIDGANVYWYAPAVNSTDSAVDSCPRAG